MPTSPTTTPTTLAKIKADFFFISPKQSKLIYSYMLIILLSRASDIISLLTVTFQNKIFW